METPLLVRDENHDLAEFWSPTRRPPRAPPPSPKLQLRDTIGEQHTDSSSRYRTLAYVHQQLEHEAPDKSPHNYLISHSERSPRCSAPAECSSVFYHEPLDNIYHNARSYDDDGLTRVNAPSSISSIASEMNILSELSRDSDCESLDLWIESSPKYPFSFHKPWMSALPTHESFPKANRTGPRSNTLATGAEAHRASCPSHALKSRTRSPRATRTGSLDPALDAPLSISEAARSQSWAGIETCRSGSDNRASPMPSEKSSWEPDSSDDEPNTHGDEQKPRRFHKRVGRSFSTTFGQLFCR